MTEEILASHPIDRDTLSEEYYFLSLVNAAQNVGLLSETDVMNLQSAAVNRLGEKVRLYTHGESSSVRREIAEELMASILYTVSLALKSAPDTETAVRYLKEKDFNDLYQMGVDRIRRKYAMIRKLTEILKTGRVPTHAVYYRVAAEKLPSLFFRKYQAMFFAHDEQVLPDYPLLTPVSGYVGIEFMQKYLEGLFCETQFLRAFPPEKVDGILYAGSPQYADEPTNILLPVLRSALAVTAAGGNPRTLAAAERMTELCALFAGKTEEEVERILSETLPKTLEQLSLTSTSLHAYLQNGLSRVAVGICAAMQSGNAASVFLSPREKAPEDRVLFRFGKRMDDDAYEKAYRAVENAETSEERLAVVKKELHSLYDLEDMMVSYPFTDEEILSVFATLRENELSFLLKKHPFLEGPETIGVSDGEVRFARLVRDTIAGKPKETAEAIARFAMLIDDSVFEN